MTQVIRKWACISLSVLLAVVQGVNVV